MKRISTCLLAGFGLYLSIADVEAPRAIPVALRADVATLANDNNAFALDLYAQLAKTTSGNLFFSPYSIRSALAMTYAGARGETADQMRKVLHLSLPSDRLAAASAALASELGDNAMVDGKPAYELSIANALWGQSGFPFNADFMQLLQTRYGAGLRQTDFISGAEGARQEINQWVEQRTQEKIPVLLPEGSLDTSTRLVLVDAIYFKGEWMEPFDKRTTNRQPFYLDAHDNVMLPMMHARMSLLSMENDDFQAIAVPYMGDSLSMLVFLPRRLDGLDALEERLTAVSLDKRVSELSQHKVLVSLPRFRSEQQFELAKTLPLMGMTDAFGEDADFWAMAPIRRLYIKHVVHKAYVEVNEEGTEAAAATGVVVDLRRASEQMIFSADHPFLFMIRDEQSGAILFIGRVTDPRG